MNTSLIEKLAKVNVLKNVIRSEELELNKWYTVMSISAIKTQYGRAVILEMEDNKYFLPKRYADAFSDGDISKINTAGEMAEFMVESFQEFYGKKTPMILFKNI